MGKLAPGLTALALAAALTACGSEAAPAPTPTPTVAPTLSPTHTASPAPTPPVMPEGAKAHTEAGAKAFVVYYWQVVDYAQQTLDVAPIAVISDPRCGACQAGITTLKRIKQRGGHLIGGSERVSRAAAQSFTPGRPAVVSFSLTNTHQEVVMPGEDTVVHAGGTVRKMMVLNPQRTGWAAADLRTQS